MNICKRLRKRSKSTVKTVKARTTLKCSECKRSFRRQHWLTRHIKDVHGKGTMTCELCRKSFRDRFSIARHLHSHSRSPLCFCTLCNETFMEFDDLEAHVNVCRKERLKKLEQIQKRLELETGEYLDLEDVDGTDPIPPEACWECREGVHVQETNVCTQKERNRIEDEKQIESFTSDVIGDKVEDETFKKASSESEFICEICGVSLQGRLSLTDHYRVHEPKQTESDKNETKQDSHLKTSNESRDDLVDQYWNQHSWNIERSLIYTKGIDEKSTNEWLGESRTDLLDSPVVTEEIQSIPLKEGNQHAYFSSFPMDYYIPNTPERVGIVHDQEDWVASGAPVVPNPHHVETNTTYSMSPCTVPNSGTSKPIYFDSMGGKIKTYVVCSSSLDQSCQLYRWSACEIGNSDQQYAIVPPDPEGSGNYNEDNHIIRVVSNSDVDNLYGGSTITIQTIDTAENGLFDAFLSSSSQEMNINDIAPGKDGVDQFFQCCHCQTWLHSETDLEEHVNSAEHKNNTGFYGSYLKEDDSFPHKLATLSDPDISNTFTEVCLKEQDENVKSTTGSNDDNQVSQQGRGNVDIALLSCQSPCLLEAEENTGMYGEKTFPFYRNGTSLVNSQTGIEKPFQCDKCPKSYLTRSSLDVHYTIHTRGKQECHICGKMVGPAFLKTHVRSHNITESSKNTVFECEVCGKTFQSMRTLALHQYSMHHVLDDSVRTMITSYKCPHCKDEMPNKPTFIAHVATHTDVYPFECNTCKKGFLYQSVLKIHMSRYHADSAKKVACVNCGEEFYTANHLQRHKRRHSLAWSFVCGDCGRGFRWRDTFEGHLKMHKGHAPFRCDPCEKTFTAKRNWVAHQQVHAEDEPYRCDACNTTIRKRSGLAVMNGDKSK